MKRKSSLTKERLIYTSDPLQLSFKLCQITCLLICALFCLLFGIVIQLSNNRVIEFSSSYNSDCSIPTGSYTQTCTVISQVSDNMPQPSYLYYELTKIWQNHRKYVKSVNALQIRGETDYSAEDKCKPLIKGLDNKILYPCGLQGWSYFNDDIKVKVIRGSNDICDDTTSGSECTSKENIALEVDTSKRFAQNMDSYNINIHTQTVAQVNNYRAETQIPGLTSESLMVWMRMAATPTFKKIYSIINIDLQKDDVIHFSITANFNSDVFGGSKTLVVSTMEQHGGNNKVLSGLFLSVGTFVLLSLFFIFILQRVLKPTNVHFI